MTCASLVDSTASLHCFLILPYTLFIIRFHRGMTTTDSSVPKSQFVRSIQDRSSDWELNPSRRAVEHGKLVKRQKSSAIHGSKALGTKESPLPPIPQTPPSFRINPDGTIKRENASSPPPTLVPSFAGQSTISPSHPQIPQGGVTERDLQVGCSCFSSFGFRLRGMEHFPFDSSWVPMHCRLVRSTAGIETNAKLAVAQASIQLSSIADIPDVIVRTLHSRMLCRRRCSEQCK